MKSLMIYLMLAAFLTATCYTQFAGYNSLTTPANDDPQACLLTLTYTLNPNNITFTETINNPYQDCTYQNLTFQSQFDNNALDGQITLAPTSTPNVYQGLFTMADFARYNGTACVNIVPHDGYEYYYFCRFKYGSTVFSFLFLADPSNGAIDTYSNNGLLLPLYGTTYQVNQNGTTVWKSTSQSATTNIVGQLYSQCGGYSTNIPSGNNEVYVTGTQYSSNQINLNKVFGNFLLYTAIIKQKGAPANQYLTTWILNNAFSSPPASGNCTDLQFTYGSLVSDLTYCSKGCDVSFFLLSNTYYVLRTSGFTYTPKL